ncbi:hypothetical protein [Halodesulfovibrio marinisediminis]|uniref:DUF2066 domain-containing protein n=1 Tax=Halodesulfovibrio marinisediminis DSM 17456 TaxID=1121457 RepID=A0A1N6DTU4_9BACT|nr:hypothetical protein [Halodesulfovibrio marinisediminis]SIN74215.1 hypothetical protein SAMN02745161_0481 [Halodesulfovibrio marinisediminis DSM 17456]
MMKQKLVLVGLAFAAVLMFSSLVQARVAQSVWYESVPEGAEEAAYSVRSRSGALQAAFVNAVFDESLEIIGYPITDVRKEELRKFLAPKAKAYVLSYRELGSTHMADGYGQEMSVEVSVNSSSLRSVIKRLGFFKTRTAPVVYNPQYSGVQDATWEKLGRLHQLYGLRPDHNSSLILVMNPVGDTWELSLQGEGAPIAAQSKNLDDAWHSVWGQYFSQSTSPQPMANTSKGVLQVRGWLFPDGVEAFDRVLRGWVGSASGARLEAVVIQADSVSARWVVQTKNIDQVLTKLSEYVNGRGLTYEFQPAAE